MADAPSIVASAIAVFGSIGVAIVQRGAGNASRELKEQIEAKLVPRITTVEGALKTLGEAVAAAVGEAHSATRLVGDLRVYVDRQLGEAKRSQERFMRTSQQSLNDTSVAEEVGTLMREVSGMAELKRRLDLVETELREDRRDEAQKQRELGELIASIKFMTERAKR